MSQPKIQIEFEKKFLVSQPLPFDLLTYKHHSIKQRYIQTKHGKVQRVRSIDDKEYRLTTKYDDTQILGKVEIEKEINKEEFELHKTQAIPNSFWSLNKKRYKLPYQWFTIELDCYDKHLNYLMIAEVEFESLAGAASFIPPDWFTKEITWVVSNKKLYLYGLMALETEKKVKVYDQLAFKKTHKQISKTKDNLKKLKKDARNQ